MQAQNEFINEKIQKYDVLEELLSRDNKPRLKRSNSVDMALNDTYIRQLRGALGAAAGTFSDLAHEANTMTYDDYFETRISRLPNYLQNDPEQLASLEAGYFIFKGAAKVGEGMSALDDATGNVVSGALHKIGEGFEWLGTHIRRFMRDDLGFSQRVAQNTGDTVQIAAEIFAPGAAAKGIGAMSRVSKSVLRARFGENLSAWYPVSTRQVNVDAAIIGGVDKIKIGECVYDSFSRDALGSMNTALRQKVLLAFEEAKMINRKGQLLNNATKVERGGTKKIMDFSELCNLEVKDDMLKLNPNGEWGKYTTKPIKVLNGQWAEMHFYMDAKTGQTYLGRDFKIKVHGDKGASLFKPVKEKGNK